MKTTYIDIIIPNLVATDDMKYPTNDGITEIPDCLSLKYLKRIPCLDHLNKSQTLNEIMGGGEEKY